MNLIFAVLFLLMCSCGICKLTLEDAMKEYQKINNFTMKELEAKIQKLKILWEKYKITHHLKFTEHQDRMKILTFGRNLFFIRWFNSQKAFNFTLGENSIIHMNSTEYAQLQGFMVGEDENTLEYTPPVVKSTPRNATIDWRQLNAVTPVKDQGSCGSCYSFTIAAVTESQVAIKTGKPTTIFSEQDMVDCTMVSPYNNHGCSGGKLGSALQYVIDRGISMESEYPYTAKVGTCKTSVKRQKPLASYQSIPPGNEVMMNEALISTGPIAAAIDASSPLFQMYKDGVYADSNSNCSPDHLTHAVTVVGSGYSPNVFIVKNSWGTTWGMNGYFLITRGDDICGISQYVRVPMRN